ncbi:hypothetical protein CampHawk_144 [Bacillus phage CampHawk]|uniref:Uncharacterized protein n=2 Tax=Okubovirus camphawk TaxID=1986015 RepID=U5PWU1_9CAUD|nr:hypothetical protein CampHawk_144 [Bacillus phage CampHawk]AGY47022.1 hypothetical protein CampHawk_144 [Bacillus phage CampHawk]APZ82379.1 hypothetical protein Goe2_c14300 [Bacillus phage vB_BsuM-Goe2]UNY49097.1 hypothetical protein sp82g_160 [Bacillus phage SP82G]
MSAYTAILCQDPLRVRCNDYRNHSEMRKGVEYLTGETPVGEALGNR